MQVLTLIRNIVNHVTISERMESHKSIFWFVAVFLAPLCLNMIALKLPMEVIFLDYIFAAGLILSTIFSPRQPYHIVIKLFKWICLLYLALGFINVIRDEQGGMFFLTRNYGVFIALGIVYYFEMIALSNVRKIIIPFVNVISVIFLFQLIYSVYESSTSYNFLVESYDWNTTKAGYEFVANELAQRFQLNYFFNNLHIPFRIVFSGLLGQHNHWGTQLPFYFLLFGYIYFAARRKNKRFLVLMVLVAIATILNTSRFAALALTITCIFLINEFSTFSSRIKVFVSVGLLAVLLVYFTLISDIITKYISMTDTFSSRVDVWTILSSVILDRGIGSYLLGSSVREISSVSLFLPWKDFENLGFTLIFERGFIYFLLFLAFLVIIFQRARILNQPEKFLARLLVLNIILVSAWSNVLFRYSCFGLVAVILCLAFLPVKKLPYQFLSKNKGNRSA